MDQLEQRLETLNKEGEKILIIRLISQKTKIQPAHLILASFFLSAFVLLLGIAESLITRMVGVVYPGIKSLYAIETADKKDDKQWLTYWAIYALFLVAEHQIGFILSYFPFYYFAKVCLLIWLFNPVTMGAQKIYERVVAPAFQRSKDKIQVVIRAVQEIADEVINGEKHKSN